jgi:hypothetical protein
MRSFAKSIWLALPGTLIAAAVFCPSAAAQVPAPVVPIVVDTAVPIVVNAVKPKPKPNGLAKFEGFVMHANIAQITARAKGNDLSILTFSLSQEASTKMQQVVDKGGYQYGDKVTIYYDPATMKASKFKGKPSKPI